MPHPVGTPEPSPQRVVVAITGATGTAIGIRILELLGPTPVEVHLIVSGWGKQTIKHETGRRIEEVGALADVVHPVNNLASTLSSGSYRFDSLVVAPCTMRTLAAIALGLSDNLIARAADVALKERRRLVLLPRETPLNETHLANMLTLTRMGAVILPPMPAFYNHPKSVEDIVDHIAVRALDQLDLRFDRHTRWDGVLDVGPQ